MFLIFYAYDLIYDLMLIQNCQFIGPQLKLSSLSSNYSNGLSSCPSYSQGLSNCLSQPKGLYFNFTIIIQAMSATRIEPDQQNMEHFKLIIFFKLEEDRISSRLDFLLIKYYIQGQVSKDSIVAAHMVVIKVFFIKPEEKMMANPIS